MINNIQIIGLQRTATNYLERLIRNNFYVNVYPRVSKEQPVKVDSLVWKHCLPSSEILNKLQDEDVLVLIIKKELSKWLLSIQSRPVDIGIKYPEYYPGNLTDLYNKFYTNWEKAALKHKELIQYTELLNSHTDVLEYLEDKYSLKRRDLEFKNIFKVPQSDQFTDERRRYYLS